MTMMDRMIATAEVVVIAETKAQDSKDPAIGETIAVFVKTANDRDAQNAQNGRVAGKRRNFETNRLLLASMLRVLLRVQVGMTTILAPQKAGIRINWKEESVVREDQTGRREVIVGRIGLSGVIVGRIGPNAVIVVRVDLNANLMVPKEYRTLTTSNHIYSTFCKKKITLSR